jgi:hypothetical protein
MRNLARFLRASWDRSIDSAGRWDLVLGAILGLIGRAMKVDLGLLAVGVVLVVLLLRVLLLSPAAMWKEAQDERKRPTQPPVVGSVESGGIVNIYYYGVGDFSASAGTATAATNAYAETATGAGTAYDATVRIEEGDVTQSAPQSRRKSTRDRPRRPPSPES